MHPTAARVLCGRGRSVVSPRPATGRLCAGVLEDVVTRVWRVATVQEVRSTLVTRGATLLPLPRDQFVVSQSDVCWTCDSSDCCSPDPHSACQIFSRANEKESRFLFLSWRTPLLSAFFPWLSLSTESVSSGVVAKLSFLFFFLLELRVFRGKSGIYPRGCNRYSLRLLGRPIYAYR